MLTVEDGGWRLPLSQNTKARLLRDPKVAKILHNFQVYDFVRFAGWRFVEVYADVVHLFE